MAVEAPVNGVSTTLASAITTTGATTCSLTSATGFTNAQYHCLITDGVNYEIVTATGLSGTTLTIVRGSEAWNGASTAYTFAATTTTITVADTVASTSALIQSQAALRVTGTSPLSAGGMVGYNSGSGPPTSGTFVTGDEAPDSAGISWLCAAGGTPGTWIIQSGVKAADVALKPTAALYETSSRGNSINAGYTPTTGVLVLRAIWLPVGLSIGHIAFQSSGTAASVPTNWWFGLYDSSRVQLATTANQTTSAWPTYTLKSLAIATIASGAATAFVTTYSGLHYLGFCMTATTVVQLDEGSANGQSGGLAPILFGTSSSESGPPAFAFTASAISFVGGSGMYGYVAT